ncbi:MAG: hypothetical protein HN904_30030 [Victivallales bacterium]|nr:hypothetical protein [Victivallales bacterium]
MRTVFLLSALLAAACSAQPVPPPLFYAVVSDTQKPADDPLEGLKHTVEQVNQMAPAFVLMPGDLTNRGSVAEYENVTKVLRTFTAPVLPVVGNHEAPAGEKVYRGRFKEHLGEDTYSHRVIGGWHLIRLDSVLFHGGKLEHEGAIDKEQLAWVKQTLAGIPKDAPIFLSQHHPLRYTAQQTANEEDLLALFQDHYLPYTVTGHKHWNELYQDLDAIQHIITGSVSFSCRPKTDGTGYRLVSTVGRNLWTAWVDLKDPLPARELRVLSSALVFPVVTKAEQLLLRVRYTGKGELTFRATPEAPLPAVGKGIVSVSAKGDALRIRLPESKVEATAVIPIPKVCTTALFTPGCRMTSGDTLKPTHAALWESTAKWQYLALKRPGETRAKVRVLSPQPGATIARGPVPILAMVESSGTRQPQITLGGQEGKTSQEFVAILFRASGLQSKSHGFLNCVYVNGKLLTRIAPDRDVMGWEWFGFPVPASAWRSSPKPQFRLTAGTPTDGTGANPPANNEDYQAQTLLLFEDGRYLADPALPLNKTLTLGDNGKHPSTLVDCTPSVPFTPRRWRMVLQTVDASALAPGASKVRVVLGDVEQEIPITLQ